MKYKQVKYKMCTAKNRPSYCKVSSPKCCVNCEFLDECINYSKTFNFKIKPCTLDIFDEFEVCEFAI